MSAKNDAIKKAKELRIKHKLPDIWGVDDDVVHTIYENPENPHEWDGYLDHCIPPKLCCYSRVSKKVTSESNIRAQDKEIQRLIDCFLNPDYQINGVTHSMVDIDMYSDEIVHEIDEDCSGSEVNVGLKKFLKQLNFDDIILVRDISRFTRMNTESQSFKDLHRKLYEQGRSLYVLALDNLPLRIEKVMFLEFAKFSYFDYLELKKNSAMGNEVKARAKKESMKLCKKYFEDGCSHKMISTLIRRAEPTIRTYLSEMRKNGELTRSGRVKKKISNIAGN
jgi:hypothetical protein